MTTRLNQQTVRRAGLPLTERDLDDLETIRNAPEREAVGRAADTELPPGDLTEAALLHAVFTAGLRALRRAIDDAGYAQLADDSEYMDEVRRIARRRRPDRADED
jgi:mRNA interferase MazF